VLLGFHYDYEYEPDVMLEQGCLRDVTVILYLNDVVKGCVVCCMKGCVVCCMKGCVVCCMKGCVVCCMKGCVV